jgi:hypothetical protein
MKVTVITIIVGGGDEELQVVVFVGATRQEAITKAVDEYIWDWWTSEPECACNNIDPDEATDEKIFEAYREFWTPEVNIEIEEQEIGQ